MGDKVTYWGKDQDGNPLPEGQSVTIDTRTLTEAQIEAKLRCDHFLAEKLSGGFADPVTGKVWQTDDGSIMKLTAVAASALAAVVTQQAVSFTIIAADNSSVSLSASDTLALLNGRMFPWVSGTILANRGNKNAIGALAANADCDNYDESQGYPA